MIKDVHTGHCCARPGHGCKYSDEDCTVVTGRALQEYRCESCEYDEEDSRPLRTILDRHLRRLGRQGPLADQGFDVGLRALQDLEKELIEAGILYQAPKTQDKE